jgi:iron complex outermembrane receptor protein
MRVAAALLAVALNLLCPHAWAAANKRHFEVEAGDASLMLNEFSRQSDLQVLFDYNILRGMRTRAAIGDLDPTAALKSMLKGTTLTYVFVNDHTLAVTPRKPGFWQRLAKRLRPRQDPDRPPDEIVVFGGDVNAPPGAAATTYAPADIERSGAGSVADFFATLPSVFHGGATQNTVLGREAQNNSGDGQGINNRGESSGSTLVLLNGKPTAPSGNTAGFTDIEGIPLPIIDHIEILHDGGGTAYGPGAVGGIVNFALRNHFDGLEAKARIGDAGGGALREGQVSVIAGAASGEAHGVIAAEYSQRGALFYDQRGAQAGSDLTTFGGSDFDVPFGNPGNIMSNGQTWAIPRNQNGTSLTAAQLVPGTLNLYDQNTGATILPAEQRYSVFGHGELPVADGVQLATDALFSDRRFTVYNGGFDVALEVPGTNAFYVNPTGSAPETIDYGFNRDLGNPRTNGEVRTGSFSIGLTRSSGSGWNARSYFLYAFEKIDVSQPLIDSAALQTALNDSNPASALNPYGDGSHTNPATLATLYSVQQTGSLSQVFSINAAASRAVASLPGGPLGIQVGFNVDEELLRTPINDIFFPDTPERQNRSTVTGFAEVRAPIIGASNAIAGVERLDLTVGDRISRFSRLRSVTTPSLTVGWAPRDSLIFRSSISRFYRPPNLKDTSAADGGVILHVLPDSDSPSGETTALIASGGNPNLEPESAKSWSVGLEANPVSDLSLSLTYYNTVINHRTDQLDLTADVLTNPAYEAFVIRNPSAAQIAEICRTGSFIGQAASCLGSGASAIVLADLLNIDKLHTSGIDFVVKSKIHWGDGDLRLGLVGTYILDYSQSVTPGSPVSQLVNTQDNPLSLRMRGELGYSLRGFSATSFLNFSNSYRDIASVPSRGVSPWTTLDLQLSYEVQSAGPFAGLRFSLDAHNLADTPSPFLNSQLGSGYDPENGSLVGRRIAAEVRKRW